jgi:hypothetical protein
MQKRSVSTRRHCLGGQGAKEEKLQGDGSSHGDSSTRYKSNKKEIAGVKQNEVLVSRNKQ